MIFICVYIEKQVLEHLKKKVLEHENLFYPSFLSNHPENFRKFFWGQFRKCLSKKIMTKTFNLKLLYFEYFRAPKIDGRRSPKYSKFDNFALKPKLHNFMDNVFLH